MKEHLSGLQKLVVGAASEKKATDIIILDLRSRTDFTDFFLICSGNSKVQVQAIADSILEKTRGTSYKSYSVEGYSTGRWVILDMGDLIAHVFQKDTRIFYDLERLWGDVPVVTAVSG